MEWKVICDNENDPEGFEKIYIDKFIGRLIFVNNLNQ